MNTIALPEKYNYIGVFLTMRCNLGCDYCINNFGTTLKRYKELSGKDWIIGLSRIQTREDLPLSLQGGEPTMHPDFYYIANGLYSADKRMDLLTNGEFNINDFIFHIPSGLFKRSAPYASIRFSFHKNTDLEKLVMKVYEMKKMKNYSMGIWGITHPDMVERNKQMAFWCKQYSIDYREKEYLDNKHGNYKYPDSITGKKDIFVECKPSELLIAPNGYIFRCHSDLYTGVNPIAHILDKDVNITDEFRGCYRYGLCNPCDVKIKTNRLQIDGHTSVEVLK